MVAEEAREPRRTMPIAHVAAIVTLLLLAFGVMILSGGAGDWRVLATVNEPLPRAMRRVVGAASGWVHVLIGLGLSGLGACFHGSIMGYARQAFALSRTGFLPRA